MIAVDTSTLSAFLAGEAGDDVQHLIEALRSGSVAFPPVVMTEILSEPHLGEALQRNLPEIQLLDIADGYWRRAGETRKLLKAKKLRAKVADALIAQSCIDHDIVLITRDSDFRHFAKYCGLKLT
ncbi:MAG: PIN domain-containing protein [Rhizomicrobium sp.]